MPCSSPHIDTSKLSSILTCPLLPFFLIKLICLCHIIIIIYSSSSFSHQRLSDNKCPQVSRTLLSILADLNNAVVWIFSTRPLISKSSCMCTNPLVIVPRVPLTIGMSVTFMFCIFFSSLARSTYLSFFLVSFNVTLWLTETAKSTVLLVLFLFFVDYY